jgi:hypothetical protein
VKIGFPVIEREMPFTFSSNIIYPFEQDFIKSKNIKLKELTRKVNKCVRTNSLPNDEKIYFTY